jgi:hypothetical protein
MKYGAFSSESGSGSMLRVDLTMIVELFTELEGSTRKTRYQPISTFEHIYVRQHPQERT